MRELSDSERQQLRDSPNSLVRLMTSLADENAPTMEKCCAILGITTDELLSVLLNALADGPVFLVALGAGIGYAAHRQQIMFETIT